jgi:hypothetical protein
MPLTTTISGKTLVFLPNGSVAISAGGIEAVHGTWRTIVKGAEPEDNKLRYTLDGSDQSPISVLYSFNASNQLQISLRASDGSSSAPAALSGNIEIDDGHHLIYNLVNDNGGTLGHAVTIYGGNFRFEEGTGNLLMDVTNGAHLSIAGDSGINSLEAAENRVAGFNANDLLHFHASTDNTLSDGSVLTIPANLSFIGKWDIQNGSLVFLSKITGNINKPDIHIGFAGKLGALTAGFVYFADSQGTQFAFNISGQHVWKAGNATNAFNWQSTLGFSQKVFSADVVLQLSSLNKDGRSFSIDGHLTLQQPIGGALTLAFALKASYHWNNNLLNFEADVSDVAGALTYNLMLEGSFALNHGAVTFNAKFSNSGTGNTFALDLSFQGDRANVIQALSFHLQITQSQAGTMINASAIIRLRYVTGVGVLERVTAA